MFFSMLLKNDMQVVMNIADCLDVLNLVKFISQGTPAYIESDPAVIAAYLREPEIRRWRSGI